MAWRIFFHARTFFGQASLFILCLGSELVTKLAFGKLDSMPKSFWSVVPMFGTVQNSPHSLEMLLAKTKSSCTTYVEIIEYMPMKNKNYKTVCLNICKEGKSNEVLEYSLKSIRKGPKKAMVKNMLYPNIVDLIK